MNLSLGVIMMFASRWETEPQRVITAAAVFSYLVCLSAAIIARGDPKWGARLSVGYALWVAQIGWGSWALWCG